ncbi:hypothetical protein ACHHYP_06601 [Achlya hypogyna]|uniref:Galactose oxidase n=1 Tax=Achlya hypogyna TaxID=1202772 RepID=A0A1V9YSV5_ACHHY|nr:hypothetical protein ACHHYP_06601 [Achlya hypogyna]
MVAQSRGAVPCPAPNDTPTWSLLPSTDRRFEARDGHASAVFRGKLWDIGGKSGTYTTRRLVPTTRRSDIWNPRMATFFTEKILGVSILVLLEGYSPTPANDIWYSPDGGEMPPTAHLAWIQVRYPVPWAQRGWHCAIALNDLFYVMGGSPLNNDVWDTDSIVNGNWQATGSVPWSARTGHTCVVHTVKNAKLGDASTKTMGVLAGGWGDDTKILNDVWLLGDDRTCINYRSPDTLATEAAPWPVRAFSALVSLDTHTPSDYLFGPRMWLLGGGRTGHGNFPMFTYTDMCQSRDGGGFAAFRSETTSQQPNK